MPPDPRQDLGREGEALAAAHLERLGFRVVARNVRVRRAEVDLVALDDAGAALIEVKTRRTAAYGFPYEAVDKTKRERILAAAPEVLAAAGLPDCDYRLGVVSVVLPPGGRPPRIEWIDEA